VSNAALLKIQIDRRELTCVSIRHWEKIAASNSYFGLVMDKHERNNVLELVRELHKEFVEIECCITIISIIDKMEREGL